MRWWMFSCLFILRRWRLTKLIVVNPFIAYTKMNIILYTLNLHRIICQLYLNKLETDILDQKKRRSINLRCHSFAAPCKFVCTPTWQTVHSKTYCFVILMVFRFFSSSRTSSLYTIMVCLDLAVTSGWCSGFKTPSTLISNLSSWCSPMFYLNSRKGTVCKTLESATGILMKYEFQSSLICQTWLHQFQVSDWDI